MGVGWTETVRGEREGWRERETRGGGGGGGKGGGGGRRVIIQVTKLSIRNYI